MKLLFDQNLSPRLPRILTDIYPESVHVREIGMRDATDTAIWEHAKTNDLVIVSKDSDFRVGNCPVKSIEELLRNHSVAIHTFARDHAQSHLMLP